MKALRIKGFTAFFGGSRLVCETGAEPFRQALFGACPIPSSLSVGNSCPHSCSPANKAPQIFIFSLACHIVSCYTTIYCRKITEQANRYGLNRCERAEFDIIPVRIRSNPRPVSDDPLRESIRASRRFAMVSGNRSVSTVRKIVKPARPTSRPAGFLIGRATGQ